ncbi:hypothetical protein [Frigoribacterium sp. CFBP9030]|uniref:hypothetical protein n=1 Tax=Frigoribacterium sp. CFBP9030 TaxID=3096537 RepID=UPI002A6B766D|nr:hypothetical protein [Frigoribacterium sp. CFBP9030]MDY0891862.1 hypothetical protein [Frigoribacterium sp. CFBP9030]
MSDDTRPDIDALIAAGRRDVADADRCEALGIAPASHQLHRRLREVIAALAAEHERADALALIIEQAKAKLGQAHRSEWVRDLQTSIMRISFADVADAERILGTVQSAALLAAHDAEVKAQALDEVTKHLIGPYVSFAQLHTRAAALRKGGI